MTTAMFGSSIWRGWLRSTSGGACLIVLTLAANSFGQGTLLVNNRVAGRLDAPVFGQDGVRRVEGGGYTAQIFVRHSRPGVGGGTTTTTVGPVPFGAGSEAGYWLAPNDGLVVIARAAPGELAWVELIIREEAGQGTVVTRRKANWVTLGGGETPPGILSFLDRISFERGLVDFRNWISNEFDYPVVGLNGRSRLAGSNYVAELWVNPTSSGGGWVFTGHRAPFGVNERAGYWDPPANPVVEVAEIAPGTHASLIIVIRNLTTGAQYPSRFSDYASYFWLTFGGGTIPPARIPFGGLLSLGEYASIAPLALVPTARLLDIDGQTPLQGTNYLAQVYVGNHPLDLRPAGSPMPFHTGTAAGLWVMPSLPVVVAPWSGVYFASASQVRFWEAAAGPTWEAARQAGGRTGESRVENVYPHHDLGSSRGLTSLPPVRLYVPHRFRLHLRTPPVDFFAPPGFSLFGSPVTRGRNQFNDLIPDPPPGVLCFLFNNETQSYGINGAEFGYWDDVYGDIPVGEGGGIFNPTSTPLTLRFQGENNHAPRLQERSGQFHLIPCMAAGGCRLADLVAIPFKEGDMAFTLRGSKWETSVFDLGEWVPNEPVLRRGEAVFLKLHP